MKAIERAPPEQTVDMNCQGAVMAPCTKCLKASYLGRRYYVSVQAQQAVETFVSLRPKTGDATRLKNDARAKVF